jgi:co-chaperonin GroES (HSP10)
MTHKFKTVFDKILVKVNFNLEFKEGSILIPESIQKEMNPTKAFRGTIVAIGPDVKHVSVGDEIRFSKHAGIDVMIDTDKKSVLGAYGVPITNEFNSDNYLRVMSEKDVLMYPDNE